MIRLGFILIANESQVMILIILIALLLLYIKQLNVVAIRMHSPKLLRIIPVLHPYLPDFMGHVTSPVLWGKLILM